MCGGVIICRVIIFYPSMLTEVRVMIKKIDEDGRFK